MPVEMAPNRADAGDRLPQLLPSVPPAITVDQWSLSRWLIRSESAGGYGLANEWKATVENVADLIDALDGDDSELARAAWQRSPAVVQTFTIRAATAAYVFGADTVHGGRVCTLLLVDADLEEYAASGNVAAALGAVAHVAALIDLAFRRTVASPGARPAAAAPNGGTGPDRPPLTEVGIVLSALRGERDSTSSNVRRQISYARAALVHARGLVDDPGALDRLVVELQALLGALGGNWDAGDLGRLRSAVVELRFIRVLDDVPDTDNPLYNATVWLTDALADAAALAHIVGLIHGTEFLFGPR